MWPRLQRSLPLITSVTAHRALTALSKSRVRPTHEVTLPVADRASLDRLIGEEPPPSGPFAGLNGSRRRPSSVIRSLKSARRGRRHAKAMGMPQYGRELGPRREPLWSAGACSRSNGGGLPPPARSRAKEPSQTPTERFATPSEIEATQNQWHR
jgi:hypothetical protein